MKKATPHSRFFTGIRNGLWELKHQEAMGQAVWLFGWYIGRQTEKDGLVLGGKTLTYPFIAEETGWAPRTLQRWNGQLKEAGYIGLVLKRYGFQVRILNPKKFISGSPEVANLSTATIGEARVKSGEPHAKSGEPGRSYLYMKSKGESRRENARPLCLICHEIETPNWNEICHGCAERARPILERQRQVN